jgi:MFS family permease
VRARGLSGVRARPRLFYGWWVVAVAVVVYLMASGFGFASFGVFVRPLEAEFGWSRTEVSAAASIGLVVSGLAGLVIGPWTDRYGARIIVSLGSLALGASFLFLALTPALWYFYLLFAVMAIARSGCIFIPLNAVIMRWFVRRRSLAMAFAATGMGFSGVLMVPLAARLVESLGWRWAYLAAGFLVLGIVLPLASLVLRSRPADLGLGADGDPPSAAGSTTETPAEVEASAQVAPMDALGRFAELRESNFWRLILILSLAYFSHVGLVVHTIPVFQSIGRSVEESSGLYAVAAAVSIGGRFLSGIATNRWLAPRRALLVIILLQAGGVGALLAGGWGIYAFIFLFGLGMGGLPTAEPLAIAAYFGSRRIGRVFGLMGLFETLGLIAGPLLAGYLFDRAGSYTPALWAFLAAYALAVAIGLFLPPARARD